MLHLLSFGSFGFSCKVARERTEVRDEASNKRMKLTSGRMAGQERPLAAYAQCWADLESHNRDWSVE